MAPRQQVNCSTAETSYEEAISRLEYLVERLESGELPLDEALRLFEEGIGLVRVCSQRLQVAEGKVEMLLQLLTKGNPASQGSEGDGE